MTSKGFLIVVFLGLAVRLLLIQLPGTEDMHTNQIWGARAIEQGITRVYIYRDFNYLNKFYLLWKGTPAPATRTSYRTQLGVLDHVPDYPPMSLYLFWISTWLAKLCQGGVLKEGGLLNALFNAFPVLGSFGILLLAWRFGRQHGLAPSTAAIAAFWLNPALVLHTPALGYVDAVCALLGLGSLILTFERKYTSGVVLLAMACMTKPQGVLILPVVALVIWAERDLRLAWRQSLVFALAGLLPFLPFVVTGRFLAALRGLIQVGHVGYVSSQQVNLWWIASWVCESAPQSRAGDWGGIVEMLRVEEFPRWVLLDVRAVALLLWVVFIVLNLRWLWKELRQANRLAIFWASALQVYGFSMLSLYAKENHLYSVFVYALPLLFLGRWGFIGVFAALSVVLGLNLFLFDGFGRGMTATAQTLRSGFGMDLTVLVAFINVAIFIWLISRRAWLFDLSRTADSGQVTTRASDSNP